MADSVLQAGVRGVTDLIINPALINLDFADIRTAMLEMGKAMMGMGEGIGERRAIEAAEAAINNPLLDDVSMKGARGVIINVTGGADMTLFEVDEACNRIREEVDPDANIIFGASFDETMEGIMRVSIVATGIDVASTQKSSGSGGGLSNTVLNTLTSAQQQERKLDRTRPQGVVEQSASMRSAVPTRPAAATVPMSGSMVGAAVSRRVAEPAEGLYDRAVEDVAPVQNYVAQQSVVESNRGVRYQDSFIPPAPVEAAQQRVNEPVYASAPVQEMVSPPIYQQVQQPVQQSVQAASQPQHGYVLRPPVPPSAPVPKKRTQSLFERFTNGLRHEEDDMRAASGRQDESSSAGGDAGAGDAGGAGLRAPTKQTSYHAQQQPYQQGSLNIDTPPAPAATRPGPQVEDELDIPAFLRRQAN